MPDLLQLKEAEVQHKYASIKVELDIWQALTDADQPLEKHHRQVRRVSNELTGMISVIERELAALAQMRRDPNAFFGALVRLQFLILEVHHVWQYFREKLALRQGPPYRDLLETLDEFVWHCYQPLFKAPPEPPLVVFVGERSPAAAFRHSRLRLAPLSQAGREGEFEQARLQQLVIPLISLPWYESTYLPEALMLAHEVGHLVDHELGLAAGMEANLAAAKIDAQNLEQSWRPWRAEIFADLFGVLCLGPAYAWTLLTLLADAPHAVLSEADPRNRYPSDHLRMQLVFAALRGMGFYEAAQDTSQSWAALYNPTDTFIHASLIPDVEAVVEALLAMPLDALSQDGQPCAMLELTDLCWNSADQTRAFQLVDALRLGLPFSKATPRQAMAAAQLTFLQPVLSGDPTTALARQNQIVTSILSSRIPGVRDRRTVQSQLPTPDALANADETQGRRLAESLLDLFDRPRAT